MSIFYSTRAISNIYIIFPVNHLDITVFIARLINNRHFLPFRRTDLTVYASLQRICGR